MEESKNWIKLHSKILNWEWYKDVNTKTLFIHLLLKANWKEEKYQGLIISRGSVVTGRKKLSEETGISEQSIRTSLNRLKSTNEITINAYQKFSVITIVNYELYQTANQKVNQQPTSNQPATNQQLTTIIEYKNNRIIDNDSTTTNAHASEVDNSNLYDCVEKAFGRPLSSTEYETINAWKDNDLTRYAIKQTELARAFNVKYTQRILENYKKDNIKTVTEAEERDRKYQENKIKKNSYAPKKSNSERLKELMEKARKEDEEDAKRRSSENCKQN